MDFMEALYLSYKQLMLLTAGKYFSSQEDREDIVQDTMLRLLRHAKKLEGMETDRVPGYIVFTARSAAIDLLRKRSRSPESPLDDETSYDIAAPILDRIILEEDLARLQHVWPSLTPEEQLLLEGKYIWRCADAELAETLGCQQSSIRMMLTRARRSALSAMNSQKGGKA